LDVEKLVKCLDFLPVGIILVGEDKIIRWANREAVRIWGSDNPEELQGKPCRDNFCPSDSCPILEEGQSFDRSSRILIRKDGSFVPVLKATKILDLNGERLILEAFQLVGDDLYKRYFEVVSENTGAMVLMIEKDLSISMVNSAFLEHTGYSRKELLGKPVTMLLHPEDLPVALERHKARLRGEPAPSAYEIRVITKDGRVCWALVTPTVIPQTHQTIISALNFTKEKEARDLLESIFLSAPISMWLAQDGRFRLVNPRLILNMGYSEAEFAEMHPLDLVYPEDREKVRRAAREMLKGRRTEPYEFRAVRKDGSITWDLGMVTSVTFEGRPAVLGYIMNIERQKKLQEQLALEKARAEALIENAPLLVVGLGVRSKILLFNRYAEKVTGYRSEEVLGKEWIELFIAEELREEVYEVWKQVVQRKAVVHEYENPIVTKDGSRRIIKWYNKVITEGSEFWMVLSMGEDITEIRRLEEQRQMMLEALPNPAWLISKDRKIVAQNQAAREIFKSEEGQWCWDGIWSARFLPEEQKRFYRETGHPMPGTRCIFCEADQALREGKRYKKEVEADGTFWEGWWVPVSKDFYVHYAVDITHHKRMEKELYSLSITDPLTGIYNRRYFQEKLEEEIERVRRGGGVFSVVMFDIDHFKTINDQFGHQVGDTVLKTLVKIVKDRIRRIDILARWGGEEFVLLLPNTTLENAKGLAEELRRKIETLWIPRVGKFTVSFGVTEYRPQDDPDTLVFRADAALYEAKREGRNRVRAA